MSTPASQRGCGCSRLVSLNPYRGTDSGFSLQRVESCGLNGLALPVCLVIVNAVRDFPSFLAGCRTCYCQCSEIFSNFQSRLERLFCLWPPSRTFNMSLYPVAATESMLHWYVAGSSVQIFLNAEEYSIEAPGVRVRSFSMLLVGLKQCFYLQ